MSRRGPTHHTVTPGPRVGNMSAPGDRFDGVLAANARYVADFQLAGLPPRAAQSLAVLTCMDSRIEPLAMLGLAPGDAKILRNAGARVSEEVLRTLVLARYLLDVRRVMVVVHTGCAMAAGTEQDIHDAVRAAGGPDTRSLPFRTVADQEQALRGDVQRVRSWPYLSGIVVGGFRYDVDTGRVSQLC